MAGERLQIGDRVRRRVATKKTSLVMRKPETAWIVQKIRERHATIPSPGNRNDISVDEFNAMHQQFVSKFLIERSTVFNKSKLKELHRVWKLDTLASIGDGGVEDIAATARNVTVRQLLATQKRKEKEDRILAKETEFKLHTENLLSMSQSCSQSPYFHQELHFDNPETIESGKLYFDKVLGIKQQLAVAAHESMDCQRANIVLERDIRKFAERFPFAPWARDYIRSLTQQAHTAGKKRTQVEFGSARGFPIRGSHGNGRESRRDPSTYPTTRSCVDGTGKLRKKLGSDLNKMAKMEDELNRRQLVDKHGNDFVSTSSLFNNASLTPDEVRQLDSAITTKSVELATLIKRRKDFEVRTTVPKSNTVAFIASSNGKFRDYYGGDAKQSKDVLNVVRAFYGCPTSAASEKGINMTSAIKDRLFVG